MGLSSSLGGTETGGGRRNGGLGNPAGVKPSD